MSELLNEKQIQDALARLDGWELSGDSIVREASLPTFPIAITAVDRIAVAAEAADHHPDMDIRWRTVTFACSTHSEGGLTEKDFALAGEIDRIIAELS